MDKEKAAKIMSSWWASKLLNTSKREVFVEKLEPLILAEITEVESRGRGYFDFLLYVDYDPVLLEALRLSEIPCRDWGFSADAIFNTPPKTGIRFENGKILTKTGYGAEWVPLKEIKEK